MSVISCIILALLPGLISYPIFLFWYAENIVPDRGTWVDYPIYITRSLAFSVSWPFLGLLWIIIQTDNRIRSKKRAVQEMKDLIVGKSQNDGKLRFWTMGGEGLFFCNDCNYTQKLVSFLHGIGIPPWTNRGYQCQKCGKFYEIEYADSLDSVPACECGGILSREYPLFCPACTSFQVSYLMTRIT